MCRMIMPIVGYLTFLSGGCSTSVFQIGAVFAWRIRSLPARNVEKEWKNTAAKKFKTFAKWWDQIITKFRSWWSTNHKKMAVFVYAEHAQLRRSAVRTSMGNQSWSFWMGNPCKSFWEVALKLESWEIRPEDLRNHCSTYSQRTFAVQILQKIGEVAFKDKWRDHHDLGHLYSLSSQHPWLVSHG